MTTLAAGLDLVVTPRDSALPAPVASLFTAGLTAHLLRAAAGVMLAPSHP